MRDLQPPLTNGVADSGGGVVHQASVHGPADNAASGTGASASSSSSLASARTSTAGPHSHDAIATIEAAASSFLSSWHDLIRQATHWSKDGLPMALPMAVDLLVPMVEKLKAKGLASAPTLREDVEWARNGFRQLLQPLEAAAEALAARSLEDAERAETKFLVTLNETKVRGCVRSWLWCWNPGVDEVIPPPYLDRR